MLNEYQKAKTFIVNKNNSLIETSRKYKIPYQTLKQYRGNPEKLKKANWQRVHLLSTLYDQREAKK